MRAYTIQKLTRLVLLSILTLPTSSTNDVVLSCSANCDNETDETLPLSCKELRDVGHTDCYGTNGTNVIPDRPPVTVSASWYIYQTNIIALNITWWQQVINVQESKGFVVRFELGAFCEARRFEFQLPLSLMHKYNNKSKMVFNYQCYGTNVLLDPGDIFLIGVSSVPETYTKNHESANTSVLIPDCDMPGLDRTENCALEIIPATAKIDIISATPKINLPLDKSVALGFIIGSASAAILCFILILFYKIFLKSPQAWKQLPRVFVMCDVSDKKNIKLIQSFIEDLAHFSTVSSFLYHMNRLTENTWIENSVREADCLVFVAPSKMTSDKEQSHLLSAYEGAKTRRGVLQLGVYFSASDRNNLPEFVFKHSDADKFIKKFKSDILCSNISV